MAKPSSRLMNMLAEFIVRELGAKVLDGVTYAMFLDSKATDQKSFENYMRIKDEAIECGFPSNEVIRAYKVSNGSIIDVDLIYAKQVLAKVAKAIAQSKDEAEYTDRIGDTPERRRERDIRALAKQLRQSYDSGKNQVEVVLFNRSAINRALISGTGLHGEKLMVRYNSYALRPEDIETINEFLLIPSGIRVSSMQACEILPQCQGCVFLLEMEEALGG